MLTLTEVYKKGDVMSRKLAVAELYWTANAHKLLSVKKS